MKNIAALLSVALLCISAGTMRADGLGTPVTGTLNLSGLGDTNWFNSAYGFVPAGYGNSNNPNNTTVVIGAGNDFGFSNGNDLITVNFTADTLTITDTCVPESCNLSSFNIALTDPSFLGFIQYAGDEGFGGNNFSDGTFVTSFNSDSFKGSGTATEILGYTAVPEPGTLGMMATGLLGAAGVIRRRFIA
jgi:hypothetical protein